MKVYILKRYYEHVEAQRRSLVYQLAAAELLKKFDRGNQFPRTQTSTFVGDIVCKSLLICFKTYK